MLRFRISAAFRVLPDIHVIHRLAASFRYLRDSEMVTASVAQAETEIPGNWKELQKLGSVRTGASPRGCERRSGGIAVPMMRSGGLRADVEGSADQAASPNVEVDPVFGSVKSGDEISTEGRAEAALTSGDRSEGRRDRTCGAADLRECEPHGLVEGRNCSAAKRRVPDGSDRKRRRVWTSVPARRSWLPDWHVGCPQGRCHQGKVCRKCDTRRPAALVSMPPEANLRRGPSHRGRASGTWKATGPRQQCRGLFSSGYAKAIAKLSRGPRAARPGPAGGSP